MGRARITQACAIPYRILAGRLEICLVTSIRKRKWVLPKGCIESGETEADAALKEAWEEAGLLGRIVGESVGVYERRKLGIVRRIACYLMLVTQHRRVWKECERRERRWLPAHEALVELSHTEQRAMLAAVLRRLERRRSQAG